MIACPEQSAFLGSLLLTFVRFKYGLEADVHSHPIYVRQLCFNVSLLISECRIRQLAPGTEFVLQEAQEPHLFVIKRQYRSSATSVTAHAVYYILEGGASSAQFTPATWSGLGRAV